MAHSVIETTESYVWFPQKKNGKRNVPPKKKKQIDKLDSQPSSGPDRARLTKARVRSRESLSRNVLAGEARCFCALVYSDILVIGSFGPEIFKENLKWYF